MSSEDAYALICQVRNLEPQLRQIPAIALTQANQVQERKQALCAGFQVHLVQPVEPAELVAAIASLTGRLG